MFIRLYTCPVTGDRHRLEQVSAAELVRWIRSGTQIRCLDCRSVVQGDQLLKATFTTLLMVEEEP